MAAPWSVPQGLGNGHRRERAAVGAVKPVRTRQRKTPCAGATVRVCDTLRPPAAGHEVRGRPTPFSRGVAHLAPRAEHDHACNRRAASMIWCIPARRGGRRRSPLHREGPRAPCAADPRKQQEWRMASLMRPLYHLTEAEPGRTRRTKDNADVGDHGRREHHPDCGLPIRRLLPRTLPPITQSSHLPSGVARSARCDIPSECRSHRERSGGRHRVSRFDRDTRRTLDPTRSKAMMR